MAGTPIVTLLGILGLLLGAGVLVLAVMYIIIPICKGIGFLIEHIYRYFAGTIVDIFRGIGAIPAGMIFAALSVLNVVIGRWSAAAHYGNGVQGEVKTLASCVYRVCISHPLRLVGLGSMLEGIEQRVPAAVKESPGSDRPGRRTGQFAGYTIVGSLPAGGSGGRLFIAEPDEAKRRRLTQQFGRCPDRVVIKSFAVAEGSSLPQIVRESRALDGAKQIGLILEHELTDDRFYYAMPYVPGEHLGAVVRQLHSHNSPEGLSDQSLREAIGYIADVTATLSEYHHGGLWHKDIKPENIIIHDGRAHIVDLGLVTPLQSALTLTTHGTEYFRDPEMVRQALRGVKVHEVDGAKFDIYGAGAVLYFEIENTFPANGGLSPLTKRCPEALKWVVRRAMTDYNQRYASADVMLADLEALQETPDMFALKPADLPSMRAAAQAPVAEGADGVAAAAVGAVGAAGASIGAQVGWRGGSGRGGARAWGQEGFRPVGGGRRRFRMRNWWTGSFEPVEGVRPFGARAARTPDMTPTDELKNNIQAAAREFKEKVQEQVSAWRGVKGSPWNGAGQFRKSGSPAPVRGPVNIHFGDPGAAAGAAMAAAAAKGSAKQPDAGFRAANTPRGSAAEQVRRAQSRIAARRSRTMQHHHKHSFSSAAPAERVNIGMVVAGVLVLGFVGLAAMAGWLTKSGRLASTISVGPNGITINSDSGRQVRVTSGGEQATASIGMTMPGASVALPAPWAQGGRTTAAATGRIDAMNAPKAAGETGAWATTNRSSAAPDAQLLTMVADMPHLFLIVNNHPDLRAPALRQYVEDTKNALLAIGFMPISDTGEAARIEAHLKAAVAEIPDFNLQRGQYDSAERAVGALLGHDGDFKDIGCVVWIESRAAESGGQESQILPWVLTPDCQKADTDNVILDYLLRTVRQ